MMVDRSKPEVTILCRVIHFLESFPLLFLLPFSVFYLSGNLYAPMLFIDEAQQMDYVSRIVNGFFPYRDFLDIYGPLNWFPPALFYNLFGKAWFGVRVFMILIHLGILVLVYQIVRYVGSRFYAILTFLLCLFFLGVPLNINVTPYAFMQIYPLFLGVIFCLSVRRKRVSAWPVIFAGILTGISIFFKISSGLFLFLAGLLVCFCHQGDMRVQGSSLSEKETKTALSRWIILSKWLGLAVYALVFTAYVLPHYEKQYFFHLTLPTLAGLGLLGFIEQGRFMSLTNDLYQRMEIYRIKNWGLFLSSTLISAGLLYLLFLPSGISEEMTRILPQILKEADYFLPFPPLFILPKAPILASLAGGGWFMLSWAGTFLCGMIVLAFFLKKEDRVIQDGLFSARRIQNLQTWAGIFLVVTLSHYVIYPTPDTGHLIQSLILWLLLMGAGFSTLEQFLQVSGKNRFLYRAAICFGSIIWCSPLIMAAIPHIKSGMSMIGEAPRLEKGSYLMAHLDSVDDKHYYGYLAEISDFIKERMVLGDEIFSISQEKQVNLYAGRPLYGGRDSYLFYLIAHGRLSRESFDKLAHPRTIEKLVSDPPRFVINYDYNGGQSTRAVFPEIDTLLKRRYKKVFSREQIFVFERID